MFKKLWNNALEEYVPIGHVTNGVHLPTFIAENFKTLYTRYMSEAWISKPYDFDVWNDIEKKFLILHSLKPRRNRGTGW